MKSRREVVVFINRQLKDKWRNGRYGTHHYGAMELRDLMDYLYDSLPGDGEKILTEYQQTVLERKENEKAV